MKYKIQIEGGFTGIPKQYEGEVQLEKEAGKELLASLKLGEFHPKNAWPDALCYTVEIEQGGAIRRAKFSEHNLPHAVRKLLDRITQ